MTTTAKNLRAFRMRYHGPTDTRGARVSITDERFPEAKRRYIDRDYEGHAWEQAERYLVGLGFPIVGMCEMRDGSMVFLTDDFRRELA